MPATCTSICATASSRTSSWSPSAASAIERYLALGSAKAGDGSLLYAGEFNGYDGPWTNPDDMKKFTGLLRYSQGTATDGFSLTGAGLRQHLELHRSGGAARLHDRTDRPLWRTRSDRRRRHQPLLAVGAGGADRRGRIVEGQRLSGQVHDGPVGTTTRGTPPIRSTATSSISTTIASMAEEERRARSWARSAACRPRQWSACNRATTTSSRR